MSERLTYAALGTHAAPAGALERVARYAQRLAELGCVLRGGGSPGIGMAFIEGARRAGGDVSLYLPVVGYAKLSGRVPDSATLCRLLALVRETHPATRNLSPFAWRCHARYIAAVTGMHGTQPADFVLAWAKRDGASIRGEGRCAWDIAGVQKVPRFNLALAQDEARFRSWIREKVLVAA
jgi:hypothetical protein